MGQARVRNEPLSCESGAAFDRKHQRRFAHDTA
jgi:hypothetical protein